MKIVYSDRHKLHDPQYEVFCGEEDSPREVPGRVEAILDKLKDVGAWDILEDPREFSLDDIAKVHHPDYINHLKNTFAENAAERDPEEGPLKAVYPDVFPLRGRAVASTSRVARRGYYCFDTYTPIVEHTFEAALFSAYCALTGADFLTEGTRHVFALCRPPGHHADVDMYGGYCYFNNAALAAERLRGLGRVAILDVDYHHGNGTQNIFYDTDEVLYVSIHADPNRKFPYFWGFEDEIGAGSGQGYNYNYPLAASVSADAYRLVLRQAIIRVIEYEPAFLIISAGFDTYEDDPICDFKLTTEYYQEMGHELAAIRIPTLAVLEGGYNVGQLGENVASFLRGWSA